MLNECVPKVSLKSCIPEPFPTCPLFLPIPTWKQAFSHHIQLHPQQHNKSSIRMATPKKNNPNKDLTEALGLGPRDIEVLVKAYSCMKEPPQVSIFAMTRS